MDNNVLKEDTKRLLVNINDFMEQVCCYCEYERCKDEGVDEEDRTFFTCPFIREAFKEFIDNTSLKYKNDK